MISRRDFMNRLAGGFAAGSAWVTVGGVSFKFRDAHAQTTPGKVLIMIFQRGGADGVYLAAPYGDDDYYRLRPSCHVARPSGSDPDSAIPVGSLDGTAIGLNPNLEPMMEILDDGNLGIIPAAHLRGSSRSHFDNQAWIGRGQVRGTQTGWMARLLEASQNGSVFRGMSAGRGTLTHELVGSVAYPAITRTSDYRLGGDEWCIDNGCRENALLNHLEAAYSAASEPGLAVNSLVSNRGMAMANSLAQFADLDGDYSATAGGLDYTNSRIGNGLRLVAQLLKAGVGLECVSIDWSGGWDSHNNQRPNGTGILDSNSGLHRTQRDGAQNLLTFHRDIQGMWDRVAVLIGSEFGRTSKQNGSSGTDHGYGACWWLLGDAARSGLLGNWPGMRDEDLENGRFLAASVDCRDIMGEAIVKHMGYPQSLLSDVFPGHSYTDNGVFS